MKRSKGSDKETVEKLVEDLYCEAIDLLPGTKKQKEKAVGFLSLALRLSPENVEVRIGLIHAYGAIGDYAKAHEHIHTAYAHTISQFPKWPKKMLWGVLENRPFLRALQYEADLCADVGAREKAIELYRLLLSLNPNDNQGVRYTLSGLYAGITGEEINRMIDEGNQMQNWDTLFKLVEVQNKKHRFWKEPK